MNPFMHGEVFVTEDGSETDLDLGHYERFLDINLTRDHYITTGQVYLSVITRERKGDYLGKCVQIIPHITDEIKRRIRLVAELTKADVVLVEVGGTVGDIEGLPFLEAIRQVRLEEGFNNTLFVHVGLLPILEVTKEFKTKPIQHSVQELRRIGIQPDIIVARAPRRPPEEARKKIALFGSVSDDAVFCSITAPTIYRVPLLLDEQGMGDFIVRRLGLPERKPEWELWRRVVESFERAENAVRIAICGKYARLADAYVSINEALRHAGAACGARVEISWIETETFEEEPSRLGTLSNFDGILVPGGFGVRGAEGKILAIGYAREHKLPFLGICFGFQLAVVEYARSNLGLKDANSTELNPNTPHPVVDLLPEQRAVSEKGGTMRLGAYPIALREGTLARKLYRSPVIYERHRHRYEVNPEYWSLLEQGGLTFSGLSEDGRRVEAIELPDHPFFFATQYHPEFKSRPGKPDPAYYGFVKTALDLKLGRKPEIDTEKCSTRQ